MTDLRAYLRSLDRETLAELLYEQAERDPELHARLTLRAGGVPADDGESAKIVAVLDTLQRLLDSGTQADLAPLARRTADRVLEARQDDPVALRRAVGLYARAAATHPPEPEGLAEWLAKVSFAHGAVELPAFADALGGNGLDHLKSIVDKELAGAPNRAAEHLAEQLAELRGDVDALREILARQPERLDLRLKVVRVLREAGRSAEAVAYAARALNQNEAALRARAAQDQTAADELVRGLLEEDRGDEAWQAARQYPCSPPVRLHVAGLRESDRPGEVIEVYQEQVDRLIELKTAAGYREAAKLLRKIRRLYRTAGAPEEFAPYLADLVEVHKRKGRLLAEIRQARIALPKG